MSDELRDRLDRAAAWGEAATAPTLDGLWARGRRLRSRRRVVAGSAAVVAVVALVVGGLAVGGASDGGEDLVAGPGPDLPAPPEVRPPPEATDLPVTVTVGGSRPGEVARVDPGSFFVVTFSSGGPDPGASNEWIRGVDSEWEAWDGESWTATHVLLDGAPIGEEPTTHALDGDGTYAIDDIALPADGDVRFLAPPPTEAPPGWHRVCTGVYGDTDGADPPAVRPCVQVRVVGSVPADVPQPTTHDGTTTTHQAFAETTMPSTPGSDVRPGG